MNPPEQVKDYSNEEIGAMSHEQFVEALKPADFEPWMFLIEQTEYRKAVEQLGAMATFEKWNAAMKYYAGAISLLCTRRLALIYRDRNGNEWGTRQEQSAMQVANDRYQAAAVVIAESALKARNKQKWQREFRRELKAKKPAPSVVTA